MRGLKVAAIAVGILIAFLVVGAVIGTVLHVLVELVVAALVVGAIVAAVKVARSRKQVSSKRAEREVREPGHSRPLPRADVEPVATSFPTTPSRSGSQDIDDELARLKREMGA
jgi:hypothetical protein